MTIDDLSLESRARRLAGKVDHDRLHAHAEMLEEQGKPSATLFRRAIEVQLEERAMQTSIAMTEALGGAVYDRRPRGRFTSDGMGIEL